MINKVPVTVTKRFTFEACHRLVDYIGECEKMHGHSYKMEVTVKGIPDDKNLLIDFKILKALVKEAVIDKVDHQNLNEIMPNVYATEGNTTCESMIVAFWYAIEDRLAFYHYDNVELYRIRLWETESSYAELTADMVREAGTNE